MTLGVLKRRWANSVRGDDVAYRNGLAHKDDRGSAIIEFIFVAIVVMVPLIYLIVTVATVQQGRLAVSNAARDVGRAIGGSDSTSTADLRTNAALQIALSNHRLSPSDVTLRFVAADADCDSVAVQPSLAAGNNFAVCVIRQQALPAIPRIFSGRGVRLVGRFVVHVDDYAVTRP